MKQTLSHASVENETKKYLLVSANYRHRKTKSFAWVREFLYPVWIPKTQCSITPQGIQVTQWVLDMLEKRIADELVPDLFRINLVEPIDR